MKRRIIALVLTLAAVLSLLSVPALADADFSDVPANAYYRVPVEWASENGVTKGVSADKFAPDKGCTRAEAVTFLWRATDGGAAEGSMPFSDVYANAYYRDAVLWAVENDVTQGTSANRFSPDNMCTRAQIVTFLYRASGETAAEGNSTFIDVSPSAYYYDAVSWAIENGITKGMDSRHFSPDNMCTRAQIVTFLYRFVTGDVTLPEPEPPQSADSEYIVDGDYPYPCPQPLDCLPGPTDAATHDNTLAYLDKYDPNGAYLLRATEENGHDFMDWMDGETVTGAVNLAVHEQCHAYTSDYMGVHWDASLGYVFDSAYYTGEGRHIVVEETEVYKSEEIAAIVPEQLRTFRYDTYVGAGSDLSSNVDGIYGLMNEFTAYYWGTNTSLSLYDYYMDLPLSVDNWCSYVSSASSDYFAYAEFKYFILSYMLYAEENYPEIFRGLIENEALMDSFRIIEAKYAAAVERYFSNLDSLEAYLKANGVDVIRSGNSFMISQGGGSFSGPVTFEESYYRPLVTAMQADNYVRMYKLMTA